MSFSDEVKRELDYCDQDCAASDLLWRYGVTAIKVVIVLAVMCFGVWFLMDEMYRWLK